MNNNIFLIIKKEMARFFGDWRVMISTILLPGVLIYTVYSIGAAYLIPDVQKGSINTSIVHCANATDETKNFFNSFDMDIKYVSCNDVDAIKSDIASEKADLLMVMPDNFSFYKIDSTNLLNAPNIELYYNSLSSQSIINYNVVTKLLDTYESSIANVYDINNNANKQYDVADRMFFSGQTLASFLPAMLLMFIFSGCIAVAPESIAGEKDRGTIATLLVTPTNRKDIAMGKIISLSFFALLNGLSSFIGIMASMPKILSLVDSKSFDSMYGIKEYIYLLLVLWSATLLITSIIAIVSAIARNTKEANSMCSPMMIGATLICTIASLSENMSSKLWKCVPLLNSTLCFNDIFTLTVKPIDIGITCIINISLAIFMVFVLTKIFNNERIIFE